MQSAARPQVPLAFPQRTAAALRPGEVAQLVEHTTENRGVAGSNPALAIQRLLQLRLTRHSLIAGHADWLIAATALLLEADLLTTNVRHFPMLAGPGLDLRNPHSALAPLRISFR
jgi:hypothetical protein